MRRWTRFLAVALALGLVLTACGDDDGGGDEEGSAAQEDAGSTETTAAPDEAACEDDVCLSGILFAPDAIEVAAGDTVTWASVDSPDHTVTADDGSFDSGTLSNGDTFEHTFDSAGEFTYACQIHPSMTGTVTVT